MAQRIFISYRRDDTAPEAGRLYDRFGLMIGKKNVFQDVGTIDAGENFEEKIRTEMGRADAILVLIGKRWMAPSPGENKPRLWHERDHVRAEVRTALQGKALVLPVLVDDAPMPDAALLPEDVAEITKRNAPPLRLNTFDSDADMILRKALGLEPGELLWNEPPLSRKVGSAIVGGILAAIAFFILGLAHWALLNRSIGDSLGGDGPMETLGAGLLVLGLVAGFRYGSRRRSLI